MQRLMSHRLYRRLPVWVWVWVLLWTFVVLPCDALRILEPSVVAGLYEHVTAAFSPDPSTIHVQGSVVAVRPKYGCDPYDNDISELTGNVFLIERGFCNFADKVLRAQAANATAVIVTQHSDPNPEALLMMGPGEIEIGIPAIFVTYSTGKLIRKALTGSGNINDDLLESTVVVVIDDEGEVPLGVVIGPAAPLSVALSGVAIFAAACICAVVMQFAKRRRENRDNERRMERAREIPLVTYRVLHSSESGESHPRINPADVGEQVSYSRDHVHNEACSICLEEFKSDQQIKVLPCRHGYHPTCIDPWIVDRSELCPMCKRSIFADPV